MALTKLERRSRIRMRIRKKISGTADIPRLAVFRSNKQIYVQIVDDLKGVTLLSASSKEKEFAGKTGINKTDQAKLVGKALAERCKEKGIGSVVFDRSGYKYHGRVKSLADAAREGGLKF
jgi:large subunit ribosomal protein L18